MTHHSTIDRDFIRQMIASQRRIAKAGQEDMSVLFERSVDTIQNYVEFQYNDFDVGAYVNDPENIDNVHDTNLLLDIYHAERYALDFSIMDSISQEIQDEIDGYREFG